MMDGELERNDLDGALGALVSDREASETWRLYHLVGDAMRDATPLSNGFAERVASRLAKEPIVLAPGAMIAPGERRRRVVLSAAASVAAIALVGSLVLVSRPAPESAASGSIARATATAATQSAAGQPARVPLPRAASDYLLAHQAYAPRLALQGVVPYVRTVSDAAAEGKIR